MAAAVSPGEAMLEKIATEEVLEARNVENDSNSPQPTVDTSQLSQVGPNQTVQQNSEEFKLAQQRLLDEIMEYSAMQRAEAAEASSAQSSQSPFAIPKLTLNINK